MKICPQCGFSGPLTKRQRSEIQKQGLAKAKAKGVHIGRPKKRDDKAIQKLRRNGLSLRKIAAELNVSTWSVRAALSPTGEGIER